METLIVDVLTHPVANLIAVATFVILTTVFRPNLKRILLATALYVSTQAFVRYLFPKIVGFSEIMLTDALEYSPVSFVSVLGAIAVFFTFYLAILTFWPDKEKSVANLPDNN